MVVRGRKNCFQASLYYKLVLLITWTRLLYFTWNQNPRRDIFEIYASDEKESDFVLESHLTNLFFSAAAAMKWKESAKKS